MKRPQGVRGVLSEMLVKEGNDPLACVTCRWFVVSCLRDAPCHAQQYRKRLRVVIVEKGMPGVGVFFHVVPDAERG